MSDRKWFLIFVWALYFVVFVVLIVVEKTYY